MPQSAITELEHKTDFKLASLRWHYPNQVTGMNLSAADVGRHPVHFYRNIRNIILIPAAPSVRISYAYKKGRNPFRLRP